MVMTVDEAIEALTEMKAEIGGDAMLWVAGDSGYVRDMEIGYGSGPDMEDGIPVGPGDPDVILVNLGDFASDAEDHYERMMDR